MKVKKVIALLLTVVLLVPATLWAGEENRDLETLILSVKERIKIPKEFTEFNYDLSSGGEGKEDVYALNWTDKEGEIGSIHVTAERSGNIIRYYKYLYQDSYSVLAKISYEQGLRKAKEFMKEIKVPNMEELKLQEEAERYQGNQYIYTFNEYANGIKVLDRKIRVVVSKQTGEVTEFNGLSNYRGTYEEAKPTISLEKARKAYIDKIGIPLSYNLYHDYQNKRVTSFPVYLINNWEGKAIDAKTGEVIIPYRDEIISYDKDGMMKEESALYVTSQEGGLTPEEQLAADEAKGLMTKDEAKEVAARYFPRIKKAVLTNASLFKSAYGNQYTWVLSMQKKDTSKEVEEPALQTENISVSVNAKTGEILSYYFYKNSSNAKEKEIAQNQEEKTKEKVEVFLKNIARDKFAHTKYQETENLGKPIPLSMENPYLSYSYTRMAHDIPVNGNGINVTYNIDLDEVTSYSLSWDEVAFKDVKGVLGKEKIVDQIGLELMYISQGENKKVLAYAQEERSLAFDPFTGKRVNSYDGKVVAEGQKEFYDDLKGHPKEAIIKKLYDSGIFLPGKSFKPDTQISQIDFLRLLLRVSDQNLSEEEIYDRAIQLGIMADKEKDKAAPVTKLEAVKYIINSTEYKKIAAISNIYRYPFEDEETVPEEMKGYIALAYGLKIIEKDKTGLFNPKDTLTRADAAQMIYYLIQ